MPAADPVAAEAVRGFAAAHPALRLAPVAAVIPALDEEASIAAVLDAIPAQWCGLGVDTIVVDDGSRDATSAVAAAHGALVARHATNRGQGAAFATAYALAREHGARYIVTLDADGQWDPADAPAVLAPVVAGEADLVLGSRVLGRAETSDNVRAAGVRVFSGLVRMLTGVHVSDTSSGLRAMVTELTARVTLDQPQYQSSELLLGAIAHGYRVAERPVTMHARTAGQSAKGTNLVYGLSYARVILRTWWRERRAAARAPRARPIPAERLDG